jgi:hypothetical protein
MLAWRGKSRDDLLAALRGKTAAGQRGAGHERPIAADSPALAVLADVTAPPLEKTLAGFWSPGLSQARLRALPPSPAAPPDLLLRMSDRLDVQVRGTDLKELLVPAYDRLGPASLWALVGIISGNWASMVSLVIHRKSHNPTFFAWLLMDI